KEAINLTHNLIHVRVYGYILTYQPIMDALRSEPILAFFFLETCLFLQFSGHVWCNNSCDIWIWPGIIFLCSDTDHMIYGVNTNNKTALHNEKKGHFTIHIAGNKSQHMELSHFTNSIIHTLQLFFVLHVKFDNAEK
ncbi:hypothetical protein ACJX0J_012291, partial [Zea mays]